MGVAETGYTCVQVGCILHVTVCGEIDHHSAVTLRQGIDQKILETRPKRVEFDLSGVGFMDSSGIGLLMGRYHLMQELGGDLVIRGVSPATDRIVRLAGLDRMIDIQGTRSREEKERIGKKERRVKKHGRTQRKI